jgi:hypothetical protein
MMAPRVSLSALSPFHALPVAVMSTIIRKCGVVHVHCKWSVYRSICSSDVCLTCTEGYPSDKKVRAV